MKMLDLPPKPKLFILSYLLNELIFAELSNEAFILDILILAVAD